MSNIEINQTSDGNYVINYIKRNYFAEYQILLRSVNSIFGCGWMMMNKINHSFVKMKMKQELSNNEQCIFFIIIIIYYSFIYLFIFFFIFDNVNRS